MAEAYICAGLRTPIGRYAGVLSSVRTDDLAAIPLRELMARHPSVDWAAVDDVVVGVYEELATAPCAILNATLDDVLGVEERPNMPGTIDEWPNWRLALPVDLDGVLVDERVARVAEVLRARAPLPEGRTGGGSDPGVAGPR